MARPADPNKPPSATERRRMEQQKINRQGEELRQELLALHEKGTPNVEIQRITGMAMQTIKRWIEGPQQHYHERTLQKAYRMRLDDTSLDPGGATSVDPKDIARVYTAFSDMRSAGLSFIEIARIVGVQEATIRRILSKQPGEQRRVHRKFLIAAERCENYLANRRRKSQRARAPLPVLRCAHAVVGAGSDDFGRDGAGDD